MIRAAIPLAAAAFTLAGCGLFRHRAGPPPTGAHYVIGHPYKAGGEWQYPHAVSSYDRTGLSTLIAPGHDAATSDGEAYNPDGLMAQSPVLPLPSIVRVTNLQNGRSLVIRVNDRGPDRAGRVIALTPRVARLLGMPADGVAQVRVTMLIRRTAELQQSLGIGPHLSAAPVAAVTASALPPPPGAAGAAGAVSGASPARETRSGTAAETISLSGMVHAGPPMPGRLYVEIPGFGSVSAAATLRARLADMPGTIAPAESRNRTLYDVLLGPYASAAAADTALNETLRRGISDPEIVVR